MNNTTRSESGFSLIEVMISFVVLSIVIAGFTLAFSHYLSTKAKISAEYYILQLEPFLRARILDRFASAANVDCSAINYAAISNNLLDSQWTSNSFKVASIPSEAPATIKAASQRCAGGLTDKSAKSGANFCLDLSNSEITTGKLFAEIELSLVNLDTGVKVNCADFKASSTKGVKIEYVLNLIKTDGNRPLFLAHPGMVLSGVSSE